MNLQPSSITQKDSNLMKFGLCSFLIGVFFWVCVGFFFLDPFNLGTYLWNMWADKLDDGYGIGGWIVVGIVLFIFPTITHLLGLLFGLVGLWTPKRTFAIFGLIINAILPILLLSNQIYSKFLT